MDVPQLLGERIRRIRAELGLTQEELAFRCNTYQVHIGRIERAENNTSLDVICRVADGLQVSVSDLLNFEKELEIPSFSEPINKVVAYMQSYPAETQEQILKIVKTFDKR